MLQISETIGNVQLMQKINRLKVLNYIRQHGEVARPEIAKNTGLSPSSVTNIVTYLMEKKLVIEMGRVDSKEVGRKAILIRFNPSSANVISVNIEINRVTIALTDLDGNIIRKNTINLLKQEKETEILNIVENGIENIISLEQGKTSSENIIGIGIAVSGLVIDDGKLEVSASLRWKDISLREYFEKRFHLPIYIQNNSKTKALAVLKKNGMLLDKHVVFLDLAMGVGMISFYDKEINEAVIGEIGHTTVKKDGPECFCGNKGCLEVMCSVETIISQCKDLLKTDECSKLKRLLIEKDLDYLDTLNTQSIDENKSMTYDMILNAFDAGDKGVRRIFKECGEYLGIGIANIINLFNPTKIIIDGDILLKADYIYEIALEEAKSRAYARFMRDLEFIRVNIDTETAIKGISLFVTEKIFDLMGPDI